MRQLAAVLDSLPAPPTADDLDMIVEVANRAIADEYAAAEAAAVIAERTPFGARLAGILPDSKGELIAFLSLLVAVLTLVLGEVRAANQPATITPEQVEEIIQRVVEHVEDDGAEPTPAPASSTAPRSPKTTADRARPDTRKQSAR